MKMPKVGDAVDKVAVISIAVFVPVYLNVHAALRGIETRYVELAETLGLSRSAFLRQIILPGALPGLLLGLRLRQRELLLLVQHRVLPGLFL